MKNITNHITRLILVSLILLSSTGIGWSVSSCQCIIEAYSCCQKTSNSCCHPHNIPTEDPNESHSKCCFSFEYFTSDINFIHTISDVDFNDDFISYESSLAKSTVITFDPVILHQSSDLNPTRINRSRDKRLLLPFLQRFLC